MITSRSDDGDVQHSSRPHTMLGPTVLNRNDMLCVTSLEVEFLSASSCNCFHTVFVVQQLIASSCRLDLRFLVNSTLLHTIPYTQDEIWTPLVSRSAILEYKFKSAPRFLLFSSKHAFERCAREMKRPTESCNKRTYSTCIRRWPRSIATGQEEEPLMAHTLFITSSRKSPKSSKFEIQKNYDYHHSIETKFCDGALNIQHII